MLLFIKELQYQAQTLEVNHSIILFLSLIWLINTSISTNLKPTIIGMMALQVEVSIILKMFIWTGVIYRGYLLGEVNLFQISQG